MPVSYGNGLGFVRLQLEWRKAWGARAGGHGAVLVPWAFVGQW